MTMAFDDPQLLQRGRASVEFLTQAGKASGPLLQAVDRAIAERVPDSGALPEDLSERAQYMEAALADCPAYAAQKLVGDWHARMHGRIATEAFEQIKPELDPQLDRYLDANGPASLELDADLLAPDYWEGVQFHRTTGAWEGHEHMGYIHGEIVHKQMVARLFPGGIFKQRRAVAAMAPRDRYRRILDMGCSSGHFTTALQETYPDAEIVGVDLSRRMLEHALRTANYHGWPWQLYQRAAERTGFAEGSFDLVASYIMLHEMPAAPIRAVFAEAFRVLQPGGDMIMSDVARFADLDKVAVWKADRTARFGGEPHWRESASLDLGEVAREAGFVDVKAEGTYPHVVQGRKP